MAKTEKRDKDGILDSREAGAFLREILTERGMQIQQLAEKSTVSDPDYLSNLLSGRINVGRSKHFPSIARALGLNAEDVAYINPNLIVQVAPLPGNAFPPVPPVVPFRETPITIPRELLEMVEKYGDSYPVLKTEQMQRMLAAPRNFGGAEVGPQTAEDWFDYWMANKRFLT